MGIEKFLPKIKTKSSKKRNAKAEAEAEAEAKAEEETEVEQEAAGGNEEADEELVQDDEDEELDMDEAESNFNWGAKDPRAGGVDVILPQLHPDFAKVAEMLLAVSSDKSVRNKNRQPIVRLVKRFQDLSKGVYPLKLKLPKVGLGLTPNFMRQAHRRFLKEELVMSEKKENEKKAFKASQAAVRSKRQAIEDVSEDLLNDPDQFMNELESNEEPVLDDGEEGDEEDDEGVDEEDDDVDDEEDEEVEDEGDEDGEEEDKEVSKKDEKAAPSEEDTKKAEPVTNNKNSTQMKVTKSAVIKPVAKFEVDDDWSDEVPKDVPMKQLKNKLKAQKRQKSSWTESPLKGETEIVIPSKKYKGAVQLKLAPEEPEEEMTLKNKNRRVNFILNKNTSQKHMDYQRTLRDSPGIPHDPDRQPTGGVLKRTSLGSAKMPAVVKESQVLSKRQRRSMK